MCCVYMQALSQALLQVRADLVETAQKTLEGEAGKEEIETNVHHLVSQKTQELQVSSSSSISSSITDRFSDTHILKEANDLELIFYMNNSTLQ